MLFFLFNVTATAKYSTYLHTLSLHDALPMSLMELRALFLFAVAEHKAEIDRHRRLTELERGEICIQLEDDDLIEFIERRSEEHRSELQSLMSISYGVFCSTNRKAILSKFTEQSVRLQTAFHSINLLNV